MIDNQDTARLSVNLASMKTEMLRFLDTHFETKKQEIAALIEKTISEFDLEGEIRRQMCEAIRGRVAAHVSGTLGWASPLTRQLLDEIASGVYQLSVAKSRYPGYIKQEDEIEKKRPQLMEDEG